MYQAKISADVRIGYVHLRVTDLERSIQFYRDQLGFTVTAYGPDFGLKAAFLAAGNYHHHFALNAMQSEGGNSAPVNSAGLHHVAILFPDHQALGQAVKHLVDNGYPLDNAQDHGGSISVYLRDPDGNGLELTYDRPMEHWFDAVGKLVVKAEPYDLKLLTNAANQLEVI